MLLWSSYFFFFKIMLESWGCGFYTSLYSTCSELKRRRLYAKEISLSKDLKHKKACSNRSVSVFKPYLFVLASLLTSRTSLEVVFPFFQISSFQIGQIGSMAYLWVLLNFYGPYVGRSHGEYFFNDSFLLCMTHCRLYF